MPTLTIPGNFKLSQSTFRRGNEVDAFSVRIIRVTLPTVSLIPRTKSAIKFHSVKSALSVFKRLSIES